MEIENEYTVPFVYIINNNYVTSKDLNNDELTL